MENNGSTDRYQEIIQRIERATGKPGRAAGAASIKCYCPAHQDGRPSLTVTRTPAGKILVHCLAGCATSDIMQKIGLDMDYLTGRQDRHRAAFEKRAAQIKSKHKFSFVKEYRYTDGRGRYLYSKVRFQTVTGEKQILYCEAPETSDTVQWTYTGRKVLYNLPRLIQGIKDGKPAIICEGEKDVETVREWMKDAGRYPYTVTTPGGASDWKPEQAYNFIGAAVIVLQDNDEPGREAAKKIKSSLYRFARSIRIVKTSDRRGGDVTDWKNDGHSFSEFENLIQETPEILAPWIQTTKAGDLKVNAGLLAENWKRTRAHFRIRRPGDLRDTFYIYNRRGFYEICSRNDLKADIMRYIPPAQRSDNLLNNCTAQIMATDQIKDWSDLDSDERYINVRNGLINVFDKSFINNGVPVLLPHSPDVISTRQLDIEYTQPAQLPARACPTFCRFLSDMARNEDGTTDTDLQQLLLEWSGLALSNISGSRVKSALILYSPEGNTGKSVFINLLSRILSGSAAAVQLRELNRERQFSLSGALNKRLIVAGDESAEPVKDSSVFKAITGGDLVTFEEKGRNKIDAKYNGLLLIACNALPTFTDDKGEHLINRLCIAHLRHSIPPEKQDKDLPNKLWNERGAIFYYSLSGLYRLIQNGYRFTVPQSSTAAIEEYRATTDSVYRFISEHCRRDPGGRLPVTMFYQAYKLYCDSNRWSSVSRLNVRHRLRSLGYTIMQGYADKEHRNDSYIKGLALDALTESAALRSEGVPAVWTDSG